MLNYPCVLDISYSVQKLDFVGLDLIHLHPEKSETPGSPLSKRTSPGGSRAKNREGHLRLQGDPLRGDRDHSGQLLPIGALSY
jgi:hypothetical protein